MDTKTIRIVGDDEITLVPRDFGRKEVAITVLGAAGFLHIVVLRVCGHDAVSSLAAVAQDRIVCRVEALAAIMEALEASAIWTLVESEVTDQLGRERIDAELRLRLIEAGSFTRDHAMSLAIGTAQNEIPIAALNRDYGAAFDAFKAERVEAHQKAVRVDRLENPSAVGSDDEEHMGNIGRMIGLHGALSDEQRKHGTHPTHFDSNTGRNVWKS